MEYLFIVQLKATRVCMWARDVYETIANKTVLQE